MRDELFYLIISDDVFGIDIIKTFPMIYSYIVSIKQNVSNDHVEKCKNKVWEFYETNDTFKSMLSTYLTNIKTPSVYGKVVQLRSKEEYTRLILRSKQENWKYNGISVAESSDKINVYFY
jgi:hypothetical protein